jgi:hypothetical protein
MLVCGVFSWDSQNGADLARLQGVSGKIGVTVQSALEIVCARRYADRCDAGRELCTR